MSDEAQYAPEPMQQDQQQDEDRWWYYYENMAIIERAIQQLKHEKCLDEQPF